jgi:hypothetical protein
MSWDCPNESNGTCKRVDGAYCQPGMKGCILAGKVQFVNIGWTTLKRSGFAVTESLRRHGVCIPKIAISD